MSATNQSQITSLDEIDQIYKEVHDGFRSGKTKSIEFRKEQLLKLAYMLHDNADRFLDALAKDLGRSKHESLLHDVGSLLMETNWAYEHLDEWLKPEPLEKHPLYSMLSPEINYEPKGVVLIINAYNVPLFTSRGIPNAIAAGCAVVLKPSLHVPATTTLLAELFPKYLDQSLYRLVIGGADEATRLLSYKWGHCLFVGNTDVGKIVAVAAAKTLTPCTIELGSKSPCFVHSSAVMDIAAKRILWGRMTNGGQACVSPDYVILLEQDKEIFLTSLLKAYHEFYDVNPKDSVTLLKTGRQFERVSDLLKRTKGKIVIGGEMNAEEKYIAPTIVVDVDWDDSLMETETFGPILPIICVDSFETAFEKIRKYGEPLAACAFHTDGQFGKYARENVISGGWADNETLLPYGSPLTPLRGLGSSGMGRGYTGKTCFIEFSHIRASYSAPYTLDELPFIKSRYPPYNDENLTAIYNACVVPVSGPRPDGI